jgi:hypothetical protein
MRRKLLGIFGLLVHWKPGYPPTVTEIIKDCRKFGSYTVSLKMEVSARYPL